MPCWGVDLVCMKRYEKELAAGTWDMTDIVGRHWFAGSWNKPWLLNADGRPKDRSLLQRGIKGSAPVLAHMEVAAVIAGTAVDITDHCCGRPERRRSDLWLWAVHWLECSLRSGLR